MVLFDGYSGNARQCATQKAAEDDGQSALELRIEANDGP
jgi:hypothetical protein